MGAVALSGIQAAGRGANAGITWLRRQNPLASVGAASLYMTAVTQVLPYPGSRNLTWKLCPNLEAVT